MNIMFNVSPTNNIIKSKFQNSVSRISCECDIYLGNKECMPTLEVQVTDKGCAK